MSRPSISLLMLADRSLYRRHGRRRGEDEETELDDGAGEGGDRSGPGSRERRGGGDDEEGPGGVGGMAV